MSVDSKTYLFGGPNPWSQTDWTASDDTVRGGASYSNLLVSLDTSTATISGYLDIKALGGAGFASQRTVDGLSWDLSAYDGIELDIALSDKKIYTLFLKDEIPPRRSDGRERSSLSWEAEFRAPVGRKVVIRWEDLRPVYRGREVEVTKPVNLTSIKRVGVMMRSFFGSQKGPFSLTMVSIAVWKGGDEKGEKEGVMTDLEAEESLDGEYVYEDDPPVSCCRVS
ncbi:complex I intermediate-associated protein 30-domain-containing protein [Aspergillus egyptiacus]|nr:complex I intermediate-associated protein 30-domain-containing protein [Aspergillus egyptiacus]